MATNPALFALTVTGDAMFELLLSCAGADHVVPLSVEKLQYGLLLAVQQSIAPCVLFAIHAGYDVLAESVDGELHVVPLFAEKLVSICPERIAAVINPLLVAVTVVGIVALVEVITIAGTEGLSKSTPLACRAWVKKILKPAAIKKRKHRLWLTRESLGILRLSGVRVDRSARSVLRSVKKTSFF